MKPKPQYHITDFSVVATDYNYRVDAHVAELKEPVKGPSFSTLQAAKDHIAHTQKLLAQMAN